MEKEELLVKVGARIKELRAKKGISQAELARVCEKERGSIERIENGKVNPTVHMLYEICQGLEVSLKEFMDFKID